MLGGIGKFIPIMIAAVSATASEPYCPTVPGSVFEQVEELHHPRNRGAQILNLVKPAISGLDTPITVTFRVSKDGRVVDSKLSGDLAEHREILNATIKKWRYLPEIRDCEIVVSREYTLQIREEDGQIEIYQ